MLDTVFGGSIRLRFFSIIAIALFIGTVLLSAVIAFNEYQIYKGILAKNGRGLALFIAKLSKEALIAQDTVALDTIVNEAGTEEIAYTLIYDAQDRLLTSQYASLNYRVPYFNDMFASLPKDIDLPQIVKIIRTEQHLIEINLPIMIDTKPIGRVVIGISEHIAQKQIAKTILFVVTVNLLVALVLCMILITASRKIVLDPITGLADANRRLAQGDLTVRLNMSAKGELGLLVDSFNQMATSLDKNKEQLRVIFETSKAGIIMLNDRQEITLANLSMSEMFVYPPEELLSRNYLDLISPDHKGPGETNLRNLIQGDIDHIACERHYLRKDGSDFWGYVSSRRHNYADGKLVAIVCIITDITDQKLAEVERLNLERQLLHSQKLESLGVLAGGIAHDFNNLLAAILGNLDLGLMRSAPDSPVHNHIGKAIQACKRAADLTRQMLAYSGKGIFQLKQVDLNQMVRENTDLFRTTIPKSITLRIDKRQGLPQITADPGQIQQVIMNLITNASEAIGSNPGTISISTGVQECDEAFLKGSRLEEKPPPGRFAYIEVSDSGCGMDAETQHRLFEPFYTTKFTGRGLGMSAVLGIIKAHNGALLLKSEAGRGATFTVYFPVSVQVGIPASDMARCLDSEHQSVFTGTVLVVDDEPHVRDICVEYVRHLGYTPISASNGIEALEIFRAHADEITLIILDLIMPHMDGVTTFNELRRIRPDVKVIVSSGHSAQDMMHDFPASGPNAFIQKPFQLQDLKEKISGLI